MDRLKGVRWLYGELPGLVERRVLDERAAERLRRHYGPLPERKPGQLALLVFGVIGAALIGLGVILLIGSNWENLSRPLRAGLTFALLIAAQLIAAYALRRRGGSRAWGEGAALFLGLCVGAAIALIGQTYNIPGDLGSFLLTWVLLVFPLMYLMDSALVAIGYLAGITSWAGYMQNQELHALGFWPLAALAAPYIARTVMKDPYGPRSVWLMWATGLCSIIAIGVVIERALPGLWVPLYAGLFALFYLGGAFWFLEAETTWQRPFYCIGALGQAVLLLVLTFEDPWDHVGWNYYRTTRGYDDAVAVADYVLTAVVLIAAISLLVTAVRRGRTAFIPLGAAPILAAIGFLLAAGLDSTSVPWSLFNVYVFAVAVYTIVRGITADRLGIVNAGMLFLAALITLRFFDTDMSFIIRGLIFIAVGLGFLVTNVVLVGRRRAAA